jgi:hypothetical protein
MSITVLREALSRRPFEPFRVRLSAGDCYEIRHPENALLLRGGIYVALPDVPPQSAGGSNGAGELPDRAVFCSLLHVAAVETLATS